MSNYLVRYNLFRNVFHLHWAKIVWILHVSIPWISKLETIKKVRAFSLEWNNPNILEMDAIEYYHILQCARMEWFQSSNGNDRKISWIKYIINQSHKFTQNVYRMYIKFMRLSFNWTDGFINWSENIFKANGFNEIEWVRLSADLSKTYDYYQFFCLMWMLCVFDETPKKNWLFQQINVN